MNTLLGKLTRSHKKDITSTVNSLRSTGISQSNDLQTSCDNTESFTRTTSMNGLTNHHDAHWWSEMSYRFLGALNYETVMQHIASSKFDPAGFHRCEETLMKDYETGQMMS